jgi:hypothetical protein
VSQLWISARVVIFAPEKLANAANQGFLPTPPESQFFSTLESQIQLK